MGAADGAATRIAGDVVVGSRGHEFPCGSVEPRNLSQTARGVDFVRPQTPEPLHGRGGGRGEGRRGTSVSSEAGILEGVITEPTSVDLVGRCGLLSDLSAQGLQQAKLEGVSNFAGNVLILIEAKIPEERSLRVTPPKQPLLMMSKRLTQRRHWTK